MTRGRVPSAAVRDKRGKRLRECGIRESATGLPPKAPVCAQAGRPGSPCTWDRVGSAASRVAGPGAFGEAGAGHALAQAALLDERDLQLAELAVEEVIGERAFWKESSFS